ncbi:M23 family metallopeptidase [Clavibacter michiganensis]|uniref:M23 family metallopeptidase n=1 Tax=Clavibacter michiganensis TaxID=28447 RepID=UPI003EBA6449
MGEEMEYRDDGDPDEVLDVATGATRRNILTATIIFAALFGVQTLAPLNAANADPIFNYPFTRRYPVTGRFGEYRPKTNTYHMGTDYGAPTGTPIYAIADGRVFEKRKSASYGNHVVIDHVDGFRSVYAHMDQPSPMAEGDSVSAGQYVGPVGNTGASNGAHLHLEIRINDVKKDPQLWMDNAPLAGDDMAISDSDANKIAQTLRTAEWYTGAPGKPSEVKTVEGIYQGILQTIIGYGGRTENIETMVTNLGNRLANDKTFIDAIATATAAKVKNG